MVRRKRWGQVVALVSVGLALICATARAQVFSTPTNLSNNSGFSANPQIAVDSSGNINLVWEDDTAGNTDIFFSRSTDGGATFSPPQNLSKSSGCFLCSFNPRIAVDTSGNINVVWEADTPGNLDIFFSRSTDGGATFSPPKNLSNDPADSASPQIAVDTSGNLNVVWENDTLNLGIFFSRSTDGGATFTIPTPLSNNLLGGSISPQIAVDLNGNINVVWEDDAVGSSDISFSRSSNGGVTFSAPQNLSPKLGPGFSFSPSIAVDANGNIPTSGNIYVVWQDNTSGNGDIFLARSTNGGATFSQQNLSNNSGLSSNASMAVDASGNINVVWEDSTPGNYDIFFARSTDAGATFSQQNLSKNSGLSSNASMAVDASGNINVVWKDMTPGNGDIFFARSTDGGATFSTPQNLSSDSGLSFNAQVAVDKTGNIDVVWADLTPGNSDIFFRTATERPTIVTQPGDQTVTAGQTATFTVVAAGRGPLSYQWQKNGAAISGATSASYTTPATTTQDDGARFTVVVSNPAGSTTSNAATLTVNTPPSITSQPANQTVTAGQTATFSVTASGTVPLSYQWQKNGAAISGAASASYTTPATTTQDDGAQFTVVVSNPAGSATSNAATLTVNGPPSITSQPANQTVTAGQTATFSVTATASGTAPLSYQWQKNGVNIAAATAASYTTPATTTQDDGARFTVVVSNSAGSVTSNAATLTVNGPPSITSQPANQTVTAGQTATFSVTATASGTAPLSYQWQKNGVNIAAATAASYTTPATTTQDDGARFTVVVSNSVGSATSNAAKLTVNGPPSITSQPASQTVTAGQTATFSVTVTASGTAQLSYQWQKNGAAISGATAASYTTPATTTSDNGASFAVVVSNTAGTVTSSAATLTVNPAPVAPTITSQPANRTVTVGQTATFSVTASGSAPLSYKWRKNGAAVAGATSWSYTTPATTASDTGSRFDVVVSNTAGAMTSSAATLTVSAPNSPPTLRVQLSPNVLWPPNHNLVRITATIETSDACDSNPAVELVSIVSNEPDNGLGDGDQPNDIQAVEGGLVPFGTDVRSFLLRAERSGMETGRIYTVTYRAKDACGQATLATAVRVAQTTFDPPFLKLRRWGRKRVPYGAGQSNRSEGKAPRASAPQLRPFLPRSDARFK